MQIVAYRNAMDIDVKFLDKDGYIYQHTNYTNFKNGQIKNPYDRCIFGIGYLGEGDAQQLLLIVREEDGFVYQTLEAVRFVPLLSGTLT